MSQLIAFSGNDPSLIRCAVNRLLDLDAATPDAPMSWGLGYEQESRVLLQKHPRMATTFEDVVKVAADLRPNAFVFHQRAKSDAGHVPGNTQPFRFKHYLFAVAGECPPSKDGWTPPDYLERSRFGTTPHEDLFFRVLDEAKKEGVPIQTPMLHPRPAVRALAKVLLSVGAEEGRFSLVWTNGRTLIGANLRASLAFSTLSGIDDCQVCAAKPAFRGHRPRRVRHAHLRSVVMASDVSGPQWTQVADGEIVAFDQRWLPSRFTLNEAVAE